MTLRLTNRRFNDHRLQVELQSILGRQYDSIHLGNNLITDTSMKIICTLIGNQRTPVNVALWSNLIGNEGIKELVTVLSNIRKLFIHQNRIENEGIVALGEGLSHNTTLKMLSIERNYISGQGLLAFCHAIRSNGTLQRLFVSQPSLKDNDVRLACQMFKNSGMNDNLQLVKIQNPLHCTNLSTELLSDSINETRKKRHYDCMQELYVSLYAVGLSHCEPVMQCFKQFLIPATIKIM